MGSLCAEGGTVNDRLATMARRTVPTCDGAAAAVRRRGLDAAIRSANPDRIDRDTAHKTEAMTDSTDAQQNDYDRGFERCVVTFIDILGYRNLLNTMHADDLVKVVSALRGFAAGDGDEDEPPQRSDEIRLYTQAFSESVSDAVVRVRTVDTQSQDGPFVHELIDLMHATIECVSRGILIRGGMTIGPVHVGLDGKGPIFGNGMVRAYRIEEDEAVYPRIMIDDEAIEAYLTDPTLWKDGDQDGHEAGLARQFIGVAEDGSHFLDYLRAAGPGEFDGGVAGHFEFLRRHKRLIVDNMANADAKARRKLVWLASYHNRFIAELRGDYDMDDPNGAFYAELETTPVELFDSLEIEGSWTGLVRRLAALAGDEVED